MMPFRLSSEAAGSGFPEKSSRDADNAPDPKSLRDTPCGSSDKWKNKTHISSFNPEAHPGIVANKLTDGYPTLNPTVTNSNESLDYLFGGATDKAVAQYPVSGGLLMLNSTGAYQFDSSKQYARYDSSTGASRSPTGRATHKGKRPISHRSTTVPTPHITLRSACPSSRSSTCPRAARSMVPTWCPPSAAMTTYGCSLTARSQLTSVASTVTAAPQSTSPLVPSLTNKGRQTGGSSHPATLSGALQQAGLTWVSSDFSQHTFQLFYLERGGGGSNCHMRCNLPTVPEGTLELGKTVDFGSAVPIDDTAFRFAAYLDYDGTENGSDFEQFSGKYDVVDSRGASVASNGMPPMA